MLKATLAMQASQVGAAATQSSHPQKMSVVEKGHSASTFAMGPHDLQHGSLIARGRSCKLLLLARLGKASIREIWSKAERRSSQFIADFDGLRIRRRKVSLYPRRWNISCHSRKIRLGTARIEV